MERQPHSPEGGEHHYESHEPLYEQLSDELRIQRGIADAFNEDRAIDDETARRIAGVLHGGEQDSALFSFASSGAMSDRLESELLESVPDLPVTRDSWINALLDYAEVRGEDRGPRKGWGEVSQEELGNFTLPPEQAVEQTPAEAAEQRARDRRRFEQLVKAGLQPDDAQAQVASEHFVRQQRIAQATSPGTDDKPMSEVYIIPGTGRELNATEGTLSPERDERSHPRIYVRCLASYHQGDLHGRWVDASQDIETLRGEVQAILAASPVPEADEYAIHDHEGFMGYELEEYENLATVSRIAQGIVEHGQAFAAYAEWIGSEDLELTRFRDHFEGTYSTREAWAEQIADEVFEWPRWREAIPEILRAHVRLDLTDLALTLAQYRYVVEGSEGVYVFNPDA